MPRALLEGRGDGAFIRLGDAMTATPEQHVHNFFAAHGKLGGAFLCANGAPCMVMDARMLRALDVQTKAMGQYIAQCGDDADPTRADTLVNMIAAEGLRVDLLAAVPGSALLEDTHGFSGLAIFDIDVHDNSPAGSVSFTLGGAAIAATLANERDAAADAMEAAPWASCDAYGGTQFNRVTIRRWASVKIHTCTQVLSHKLTSIKLATLRPHSAVHEQTTSLQPPPKGLPIMLNLRASVYMYKNLLDCLP